ncbi:MAG TPA: DMT family transporter [Steroidobacteraceae bacterium]|nr:DMT family transporter [Steroidobacteraceae bacterium]
MAAILGAAGFSIKAIFVKAAFRYGVDAETLLALRMLYSLPLFLLMGLAATRSAAAPISAADWRALALLGVLGYYTASYLDFLGLQYISAALERVILFTYPTMVVLFTAWRERSAPTRSTWSALLLCYAGVALVVAHDLRSGGRGIVIGSALVFASAVSYAFYLLRAGPLLVRIGPARVAAWGTTIACLLALTQFAVLRPIPTIVAQPWQVQILSLAMAVFSTVLPVWFVTVAMRQLGAGPTAMIGSLGPVITLLLAWPLLGEALGALQLLGAGLVIYGVRLVATASPEHRSGRERPQATT